MNPYQIMGIIASCTFVFAGVVTLLAMQGVPVLLAFLSVYLLAICWMVVMQRKARQMYEGFESLNQRRHDDASLNSDVVDDFNQSGKALTSPAR